MVLAVKINHVERQIKDNPVVFISLGKQHVMRPLKSTCQNIKYSQPLAIVIDNLTGHNVQFNTDYHH